MRIGSDAVEGSGSKGRKIRVVCADFARAVGINVDHGPANRMGRLEHHRVVVGRKLSDPIPRVDDIEVRACAADEDVCSTGGTVRICPDQEIVAGLAFKPVGAAHADQGIATLAALQTVCTAVSHEAIDVISAYQVLDAV